MNAARQSVSSWQGIEAPEPPDCVLDHADLLAMARRMLQARQSGFPKLVADGQMDEAAAQQEIAVFEGIVATWQFIVTGEGEPAPWFALPDQRAALDSSLAKIAQLAGEAGGFPPQLEAQARWVIALRWHIEPGRQTIALARLTHELRARARASREETRNVH